MRFFTSFLYWKDSIGIMVSFKFHKSFLLVMEWFRGKIVENYWNLVVVHTSNWKEMILMATIAIDFQSFDLQKVNLVGWTNFTENLLILSYRQTMDLIVNCSSLHFLNLHQGRQFLKDHSFLQIKIKEVHQNSYRMLMNFLIHQKYFVFLLVIVILHTEKQVKSIIRIGFPLWMVNMVP